MEDTFDRLETMLGAMREEVSAGFATVDRRLAGVDERLAGVDERFGGIDEQFVSLRDAIRKGDEDTRSQLSAQIDRLRDDIRIFAEAHLSLEARVTALERPPR